MADLERYMDYNEGMESDPDGDWVRFVDAADRIDTIKDEYQRFYNHVADCDPAIVDAWHFGENVRVQKEARERRG